jgi:hypothetical protein
LRGVSVQISGHTGVRAADARRFRVDEDELDSDKRWYRTDMEKFRLDEQWYRSDEDFFSADELYFRSDVKKFGLDILSLLKDLYWFTSDEDFLNPDMEWYSLDADEDDLAFAWFRAGAVGDRGALQAPAAAGARSHPDEKTPSDSSPVLEARAYPASAQGISAAGLGDEAPTERLIHFQPRRRAGRPARLADSTYDSAS